MNLTERLELFRQVEYGLNSEKYIRLRDGQNPHTLFIACSDSRVDAETLLQAEPGEIFQIRNVANIVPREEEPQKHEAVISAIEYAVSVLKVDNVVVCGHSNCGGCQAMHNLEATREKLPYTRDWISQSISVYEYIKHHYPNKTEGEKGVILEKLNAIQQLDNLLTYDFVKERYEKGELNLHAYYYDIASGVIEVYDYDGEYADIIKEITANRKYYLEEEPAEE